MKARGETGKRVAAVVGLLALIVAPPALLVWGAGWPLPTHSQLSTAVDLHWVSLELARALAACAGWLTWFYVAGCLLSAIIGQLRGISVHLPAPRVLSLPLKGLVAVALVGATMTSRAAIAAPVSSVSHVMASSQTAPVNQARDVPRTCVVNPRDTLWDIADRELGDPMRWRELWSLNAHRVMADGTSFSDPDLIQPGWVLTLPVEESHRATPVVVHHRAPVPVAPGPAPASLPAEPLPSPPMTKSEPTIGEHHRRQPQSQTSLNVGLGLGAGAVGVAAALVAARRRRSRHRPSGKRLVLPTGQLAAAELALRDRGVATETDQVAGVLRLARALMTGDQEIVLVRVDVTGEGVVLAFDAETRLPAPFVMRSPRAWLLPRDNLGATIGALDQPDPVPALLGLGDGVYLNLECLRGLALTDVTEEQLAGLVTSLAYAPWAGTTDVMCLIGSLAIVDPESRVALGPSSLESVSERSRRVIAELVESGRGSLAATRWSEESEPPDGVTVVVVDSTDPASRDVLALANDPRTPAVALVLGTHSEAANHWPDAVDSTVGLPVVTEDVVAATEKLFDQVEDDFAEPTDEPYASLPDPSADVADGHDIVVRVLGPLEVTGDVPHLKPQLVEIIVYLALHDRPVSLEEMATALWPDELRSDKSLRNRVYELRKALGGRLSSGPGWVLDDSVTTDWAQFRTLAAGELLDQQAALLLIRGQALQHVRGDWAGLEGFESEMTARIVDLALDVSEKLLAAGDPGAATEAARAGLKACPWEERLYVIAMQAAADRGAIGEVTSLYREMTGVLDLEIDAEPEAESRAAYEALLREARRASAPDARPAVDV